MATSALKKSRMSGSGVGSTIGESFRFVTDGDDGIEQRSTNGSYGLVYPGQYVPTPAKCPANGSGRAGFNFGPFGFTQQPSLEENVMMFPVKPSVTFNRRRNDFNAMYPPSSGDAAYIGAQWNMIFSLEDEQQVGQQYLLVMTSAAGLGQDIKKLTSNEVLQRDLLMQRVNIHGALAENSFSVNSDTLLSAIYDGVIHVPLRKGTNVRPGDELFFQFCLPSEANGIPRDTTVDKSFVPMEAIPVRESGFTETINRVLQYFVHGGAGSFGKMNQVKYSSFHGWKNFSQHMEDLALMHFLEGVYLLMQFGLITVPTNNAVPAAAAGSSYGAKHAAGQTLHQCLVESGTVAKADARVSMHGEQAKYQDVVGRLAGLLDVVPLRNTKNLTNPFTGTNYKSDISEDQKKRWSQFRTIFLKTAFPVREQADYFLGRYINTNGQMTMRGLSNGIVNSSHPLGELFNKQMTVLSNAMATLGKTISHENRFAAATVHTVRYQGDAPECHAHLRL